MYEYLLIPGRFLLHNEMDSVKIILEEPLSVKSKMPVFAINTPFFANQHLDQKNKTTQYLVFQHSPLSSLFRFSLSTSCE